MRKLLFAALALAAVSPAAAQEAPAPPFEVVGEAQRCIAKNSVRSFTPIDARTLYVRMKGNTDYRSDLTQDCGYKPKVETLIMKQVTGSLCANDVAQRMIVQDNIYKGFCAFGPFTPVRRVKTP